MDKTEVITIKPPRIARVAYRIIGTSPYCQLRFSQKAMNQMAEKMTAGQQARKGKAREARSFEDDYQQAFHISTDGWYGIPASSFRQALISACRLVGFKMTLAKLSVFVEADGFDRVDGRTGHPATCVDGTDGSYRTCVPERGWSGLQRSAPSGG